ncbi:hypothetical protein GQ53DRAFT_801503 [Thozetella sp. PMI_491]|nr:hypothetical protein GQ53DRAFT_801503 [Thozetella sp. PMI_491]
MDGPLRPSCAPARAPASPPFVLPGGVLASARPGPSSLTLHLSSHYSRSSAVIGSLMDPGTIIAIVQATRTGLGILIRLKDAFRGDATSKRKLEALGSRLSIISSTLDRTADIPDLLDSHPFALDELRRTIDDCNKLLGEYEHAVSDARHAKANIQRVRLALFDEDKLKELHDRLDRHVGDLSLWHVAEINYASKKRDSVAELRGFEPRPKPQKSATLLTDASGTTLVGNDDGYQSQSGRRGTLSRWSPELGPQQEATILGTSLGSSNGDLLGPALMKQDGAPSAYMQASALTGNSIPTPAGEVKLITSLQETYTFNADSYSVSQFDDVRIVEWQGEACSVKHFGQQALPLDRSGIPFTRPSDKRDRKRENQLRFMGPGQPHRLEVIPHQLGHEPRGDTLSHYLFSSRRERQAFQEAVRGSCKMLSFRGLSVTTNLRPGRPIARDVNIKIWTFDAKRSTISFARNLDSMEHEEIELACFNDYKDASKDSCTVTLRVRRPEGSPEPTGSRRPSFRISIRPRSEQSASSSRRSSTHSLASVEASDPPPPLPESLRRIEWLRLEFEDKRGVRGEFCRSWTEAYRRNPLRLSILDGVSLGSASPSLQPQPGSLASSPVLLSNYYAQNSPRLAGPPPAWGQVSPHAQPDCFLGEPIIQEETSQGGEAIIDPVGAIGYNVRHY